MVERWISNASPLIVLARVGHLGILRALPVPVLLPELVLAEVEAGNAKDGAADAVGACEHLTRVGTVDVPEHIATWLLHAGESQVLAHAVAMRDAGVLLDDRAARRCARALGLPLIGTIGLIVRATRAGTHLIFRLCWG